MGSLRVFSPPIFSSSCSLIPVSVKPLPFFPQIVFATGRLFRATSPSIPSPSVADLLTIRPQFPGHGDTSSSGSTALSPVLTLITDQQRPSQRNVSLMRRRLFNCVFPSPNTPRQFFFKFVRSCSKFALPLLINSNSESPQRRFTAGALSLKLRFCRRAQKPDAVCPISLWKQSLLRVGLIALFRARSKVSFLFDRWPGSSRVGIPG